MSFCSFSKEFNKNSSTEIDNKFISSYLPEATGDAVKVYLYGLFACLSDEDASIEKFAEELSFDKEKVVDCFRYWEEFGLVDIISEEPFMVKYLPIGSSSPKKYSLEKYGQFNKSLQVLISRMITANEYAAYFSVMEDYSIKPEAMLLIVKYCIDLKGSDVGFRYIIKVAGDFAARGITSVSKIEKELSDYNLRTGDLAELTEVVCRGKKPDLSDGNLYKKWTENLGFTKEALIYAAKRSKSKSFEKLDKELSSLYSARKIDLKEIEQYYDDKKRVESLAEKICKNLSVYIGVYDPVIENYVYPWLDKGYDEETLCLLASVCFRKNRRSLEQMNDLIEKLYKEGIVALGAIAEYVKATTSEDEFIRKILAAQGSSRKPTDWDRENLKNWRSWNFSDEMIMEAAKISAGKNFSYVNAVLSSWKSEGVYTVDKISARQYSANKSAQKTMMTRTYTKEELNSLMDGFDEIDF